MRRRWFALRDRLAGVEQSETTSQTDPTTPDLPETPVPTTTTTGTAARSLASLRGQLAELDAEAEADPLELAPDLGEWRQRDQLRRDRRVGIVTEIRKAERFGDLTSNATAMSDVREYLSASAEARTWLTRVERAGHLPERLGVPLRDGRGAAHLRTWLAQLTALSTRLSLGDPDAARVLLDEWNSWFACRLAWLSAFAAADGEGRRAPEPELTGDLPAGITYGPHLTNSNGAL